MLFAEAKEAAESFRCLFQKQEPAGERIGMYTGNGNPLTDRLFNAKATCPGCGNQLTFRAGADQARENGIYDNVVVCGGCLHAYTCVLIPGRLTLQDDITGRYPGIRARTVRENRTADGQPVKAGKNSGFFSKLFGKRDKGGTAE